MSVSASNRCVFAIMKMWTNERAPSQEEGDCWKFEFGEDVLKSISDFKVNFKVYFY